MQFLRKNCVLGPLKKGKIRRRKMTDFDDTGNLKMDRCTILIQGMTCGSCVANIQNGMKKVDGVHDIIISLLAGKADVFYDAAQILPSQIASRIEEMGFDAQLIDNPQPDVGRLEVLISGMTCASCEAKLEAQVRKIPGILTCNVSHLLAKGSFTYDRFSCGPRKIISAIEIMGFGCSLISRPDDRFRNLNNFEEIRRWRNSFFVSLIFGLPVMLIMIYFHWFKHTTTNPANQILIVAGVSLDNFLLLILATPVQ
uniref:HMA domain-containing protein n=1 Tax=Romanomermis culicivorax TaxID=13658 RepID=A0A915KT82_ROMCU